MSRLNELIQRLCPNGVEFKKLGEVCNFINGFAFKSSLFKEKGEIIIRITNINGTSIELDDVKYFDLNDYNTDLQSFIANYGDILIAMSGATTGKVGYYDNKNKAYLNQRVGKFVPNKKKLNNRYLFHFLCSITTELYIMAGGGAQPNLSSTKLMNNVVIPIPPLDVQNEIVRILDTFTSHAAELQARKEQYEYYRNKLLTFDKDDKNVKWVKLKEYAEIGTGSSNTQDELSIGLYPFFVRSQIVRRNNEYEFDETAIITSGDGVGVGKIFHYVEGKYALHQRAYRIHVLNEKIIPKFLFHYMRCEFYNYITKNAYTSSVTSIRKPMLLNFPIPILSMSEQQRIVSILDKFEALVNDLTAGLPAEIAAVQEQYEYYRNKLLTFKDVGTYHGASST